MNPRSVKAGREQAIELRWIGATPGLRRGSYTYWFLDPDGQELKPLNNPKCHFRPKWVFESRAWQKHLERIGHHRTNDDDRGDSTIAQTTKVEATTIAQTTITNDDGQSFASH